MRMENERTRESSAKLSRCHRWRDKKEFILCLPSMFMRSFMRVPLLPSARQLSSRDGGHNPRPTLLPQPSPPIFRSPPHALDSETTSHPILVPSSPLLWSSASNELPCPGCHFQPNGPPLGSPPQRMPICEMDIASSNDCAFRPRRPPWPRPQISAARGHHLVRPNLAQSSLVRSWQPSRDR